MIAESIASLNRYLLHSHLEPGGYFEIQDLTMPLACDDDSMPDDYPPYEWSKLTIEAAAKQGRPIFPTKEFTSYLTKAGFVDVVEVVHKWPTNQWPRDKKMKELAAWTYANVNGGLEGLSLAHFTRGLGWTQEETLAYCAKVRKGLSDKSVHSYWAM
jgi:hypothetical protein